MKPPKKARYNQKYSPMKKIILLSLFFQLSFAQTTTNLLIEADKAFLANKFDLAKTIYKKVTEQDSLNNKAWFNLAATELNLGENENACNHLYKSYTLKNQEAGPLIKQYCVEIKNGTIMSLKDVDEKQKFVLDSKVEILFNDNGTLNNKYLNILTKEIKKSKMLYRNVKGKVFITFHINKNGQFDGEILRIDSKNDPEIKDEIVKIFKSIVIYKPAIYKGRAVETWDKVVLPLDFGS